MLPNRLISQAVSSAEEGLFSVLGITATNRKRFMLSIHSYLRRERTWGPGQELLCDRKRKLAWLFVIPGHCIRCGKQAAVKYVGSKCWDIQLE